MAREDAYDSAPPRGSELMWTRVYRKGARVAHLRFEGSGLIACDIPRPEGRYPHGTDDSWFGTGSQAEYDHAARLPLHPPCFAVREAARGTEGLNPADPAERSYL